MCTLILAIGQWADAPLVVMANRDERLGRPAGPASWRTHGGVNVFAPVDLEAGGTWIGVSDTGLLAAITNRYGSDPDPERASRGTLVLDALAQGDMTSVAHWMSNEVDPTHTNAFHLVVSDGKQGALVWSDGHRLFGEELGRGFHVLSERSYGARPSEREERIWAEIPGLNQDHAPAVATVQEILAQHDADPARATCVHLEELGYGTRSWSYIRRRRELSGFHWHEGQGAPCTTEGQRVL
jgi:uncharacterized protein with NRDE domain